MHFRDAHNKEDRVSRDGLDATLFPDAAFCEECGCGPASGCAHVQQNCSCLRWEPAREPRRYGTDVTRARLLRHARRRRSGRGRLLASAARSARSTPMVFLWTNWCVLAPVLRQRAAGTPSPTRRGRGLRASIRASSTPSAPPPTGTYRWRTGPYGPTHLCRLRRRLLRARVRRPRPRTPGCRSASGHAGRKGCWV